jgi:hypothetical protein
MFDSSLFGGGWQKRWFKLFDTEMTYQTSPNGAWKGSIDFSSCGYSFEEEDAVLSGGSLLRDCRVQVRQTGRLAVQLADARASNQKGSYSFQVVGVDGKLFRVRSFELRAISSGDTDAKEACGCWCDNITAVLLMVHSKLSISKWARGHLPFLLKAGCDAMIDQCSKVGITTVDHLLAKGLDEVLALLQDCPTVKGDCLRLLKNTLAKMMKARIDLQALAFKKAAPDEFAADCRSRCPSTLYTQPDTQDEAARQRAANTSSSQPSGGASENGAGATSSELARVLSLPD